MNSKSLIKQHKSIPKLQQSLKTKTEKYWLERGEKMALGLFKDMSERVPAYKDFLKTQNFSPRDVKSIEDFKHIPSIDKDNYLRKYPLESMCWDGQFAEQSWVISTTSGSTGKPFYFPRTSVQDEFYAITAELYMRENFRIQERTTLYIDAFAMGAWIGGLFTYEAIKRVADKGYSLSIITPGINKQEVINSVRELGNHFDQVIIGCYPPVMKDIIDVGATQGIEWGDYNLGLVFSAEGFSEEFRDYIVENAKLKDVYASTLNHYGTVDQGTLSHETAYSIYLRRLALQDKELFTSIFGDTKKQPTLTQYLPEMFYFEEVAGNIICTSNSGIPLVRYDLKDHGGVLTLKKIENFVTNSKSSSKLSEFRHEKWNLPFVYVYERSDLSVTLFGGTIYPEEIRRALLDPYVKNDLTGKFTLEIIQNEKFENRLVVHVELRQGIDPKDVMPGNIQKVIVALLLEENSEYASNYRAYGKKLDPLIKLWPNEHHEHFSGRGKQKWVKK